MRSEQRAALTLRIGDEVILPDGTRRVVTSTRLQGVGGGVVSLGLSGLPTRTQLAAGTELPVLVTATP